MQEILSVSLGNVNLADTELLKTAYGKSRKIRKIVKDLNKNAYRKKSPVKFAKAQFDIILNNYHSFLVESSQINNFIVNDSNFFYNYYRRKSDYNVLYESIYELYDCFDTKWLKEYVDLQLLLQEINSTKDKFKCPICQAQLDGHFEKDHFLPRSIFPVLSISRKNFTPICRTCNSKTYKGDSIPAIPIIIPNECSNGPLEDYIEFEFISSGENTYKEVKEYLEGIGLTVDQDQILCNVRPREGLSSLDETRVNNLINLFKLKKRFNESEIILFTESDISDFYNKVNKSVCSLPQKRRADIEGIIQCSLIDKVRELEKKDKPEVYRKYRRSKLQYLVEKTKDIKVYEILNNPQ